jgi:phage repressor protein C with HTH and peptisase S24 domain
MKSSDMSPMYEIGQTLMVDPKRPIEPGKGVVFFKADRSKFIVRALLQSDHAHWTVRRYGDASAEERLSREEWPIAEFIQGWAWI